MYIVVIPRKEKYNISLFHDWILLVYLFGENEAAVAASHDILYCWQCQLVVTSPADAQTHQKKITRDMVIQWNMNGTNNGTNDDDNLQLDTICCFVAI